MNFSDIRTICQSHYDIQPSSGYHIHYCADWSKADWANLECLACASRWATCNATLGTVGNQPAKALTQDANSSWGSQQRGSFQEKLPWKMRLHLLPSPRNQFSFSYPRISKTGSSTYLILEFCPQSVLSLDKW